MCEFFGFTHNTGMQCISGYSLLHYFRFLLPVAVPLKHFKEEKFVVFVLKITNPVWRGLNLEIFRKEGSVTPAKFSGSKIEKKICFSKNFQKCPIKWRLFERVEGQLIQTESYAFRIRITGYHIKPISPKILKKKRTNYNNRSSFNRNTSFSS